MSFIKLDFEQWISARSNLAEKLVLEEVRSKGIDNLNMERSDGQTGLEICYEVAEAMLVCYSFAPEDYQNYLNFLDDSHDEDGMRETTDKSKLN